MVAGRVGGAHPVAELNKLVGSDPRYVLRIDRLDEPRLVELWSETRLPFEPSAPLKPMRNELRNSVRMLRAYDGEHLQAVYASAAKGFCDTENVLVYNVGVGSFSGAAGSGVRFERTYVVPSPPNALGWTPLHYHRYEIVSAAAEVSAWRSVRLIATWRDVQVGHISGSSNASTIWHALRPTEIFADDAKDVALQPFGVRLTIRVPTGSIINTCAITKVLLDGAISACHAHDGTDLDQISTRLADRLKDRPADLAARLMSTDRTALGRRRLLYLRASGVQWNPADDFCMTSAISIDARGEAREPWSVSGELFDVIGV